MHQGEKWLCSNEGCGAEIVVTESSQYDDVETPRCGCGSTMKRPYEKPLVRKQAAGADDLTSKESLTGHLGGH